MFNSTFAIFTLSFKEQLAYKFDYIITLLSFPILFSIEYWVWSAIYTQTDMIAGFDRESMIMYYIISLTMWVLMYNEIHNKLPGLIKNGNFIQFITKPLAYPYFAFVQVGALKLMSLIFEVIPLFIIISFMFGVEFISGFFSLYALFILSLAFILNLQVTFILACCAFWLLNPNGLLWSYNFIRYFLAGALVPLTFFPHIMQSFLLWTPFPYIVYVPTSVIIGHPLDIDVLSIIVRCTIWIILLSVLMIYVWKKSIQHFEGVGT